MKIDTQTLARLAAPLAALATVAAPTVTLAGRPHPDLAIGISLEGLISRITIDSVEIGRAHV